MSAIFEPVAVTGEFIAHLVRHDPETQTDDAGRAFARGGGTVPLSELSRAPRALFRQRRKKESNNTQPIAAPFQLRPPRSTPDWGRSAAWRRLVKKRLRRLSMVEVVVDGGSADAELRRDLSAGPPALPFVADLVVHLIGQLNLSGPEFVLGAAGPTAGPSCGEAVAGAFGHQGGFELGDSAEDLEEHPADGGGGVNALVEHDQVNTPAL